MNIHRVDYMTIDTKGSEIEIIENFPWNEFDIRVVQIEQLHHHKFPSQIGKKERIIRHMLQYNYKLLSVYIISKFDTDDLIFVRNLDQILSHAPNHPRDGDGYAEIDIKQ